MRRDASPPLKSVQLHRHRKKTGEEEKINFGRKEEGKEKEREREIGRKKYLTVTHFFIGLLESRE